MSIIEKLYVERDSLIGSTPDSDEVQNEYNDLIRLLREFDISEKKIDIIEDAMRDLGREFEFQGFTMGFKYASILFSAVIGGITV